MCALVEFYSFLIKNSIAKKQQPVSRGHTVAGTITILFLFGSQASGAWVWVWPELGNEARKEE